MVRENIKLKSFKILTKTIIIKDAKITLSTRDRFSNSCLPLNCTFMQETKWKQWCVMQTQVDTILIIYLYKI